MPQANSTTSRPRMHFAPARRSIPCRVRPQSDERYHPSPSAPVKPVRGMQRGSCCGCSARSATTLQMLTPQPRLRRSRPARRPGPRALAQRQGRVKNRSGPRPGSRRHLTVDPMLNGCHGPSLSESESRHAQSKKCCGNLRLPRQCPARPR